MIIALWSAIAFGDTIAWDFESGPDSFNIETNLQFQWGPFTEFTAPNEECCGWATRHDSYYLNDASDSLHFPAFTLLSPDRPVLLIEHLYETEYGIEPDAGWLEAWHYGEWISLHPVYGYPTEVGFSGSSDGWRSDAFDLSGLGPTPQLRLRFISGETVNYPGWFINRMDILHGDPVPPLILDVIEPSDTSDVEGPYRVHARSIDDLTHPSLTLTWWTDDQPETSIPMSALGDSQFRGEIDGVRSGSLVSWRITATDGLNTTMYPASGQATFTVVLPPPTDLDAPGLYGDNRTAEPSVELVWDVPESNRPIIDYELFRDGDLVTRIHDESVTVDLIHGVQTFTVNARFYTSAGPMRGAASNPLTVSAALPTIDTIIPYEGWPGEQIRLDLLGENLYLDTRDIQLKSDPKIQIQHIEVIDSNHARAIVTISDAAVPGDYRFRLNTQGGNEVVSPVFNVLNTDGQPKVLAAKPPYVRQGSSTTIFVELSQPLASEQPQAQVDMGDGIFVQSVTSRGSGLDVNIVVAGDAPIGDHPITVDEGSRVLTGAEIEVKDQRKPAQKGCTHLAVHQTWWWLGLLFVTRRRCIDCPSSE